MMTNPTGRLTQGQFSFLPDLTDAEIALQVEYGLKRGYAWSIEHTDDPHPRNTYWEMFGMPMFDLRDAAGVMMELRRCRDTFAGRYIRLVAFDSTLRVVIGGFGLLALAAIAAQVHARQNLTFEAILTSLWPSGAPSAARAGFFTAAAWLLPVWLVTVPGLGHAWSGGDAAFPYSDARHIDATALICDFFASRP